MDDAREAPEYGAEDVLATGRSDEPEPEPEGREARRVRSRPSPWNRKRDRAAAVIITVAVLVGALMTWTFSDVRATTSEQAAPPPPLPPQADAVPGNLTELWQAPSPATPEPVGEQNSVVTGNGGEVAGRDALTGQIRWRYERDIELCTVAGAWKRAVAVYRKDTGCSEVTQLDADTGRRTAQRNGDAELDTRLIFDGTHVTATGERLLNTWRDDLVKSMEYGDVPAKLNPDRQPRTGCAYGSVAAASGKVGVVERCAGDTGDRLTVYKANSGESDEPKPLYSTVLAGRSAQVVALAGDFTAVALPEQRQFVVYGKDGKPHATYPLDVPAEDLAGDPPGRAAATMRGGAGTYWFTGSRTVSLAKEDLRPRWSIPGTIGSGAVFDKQLVLPIPGGLTVVDEQDGRTIRTVGVDRHGYSGPVSLSAVGPVLLEQRGETVAALR